MNNHTHPSATINTLLQHITEASHYDMPGTRSEEIEALYVYIVAETTGTAHRLPRLHKVRQRSCNNRTQYNNNQLRCLSIVSSTPLQANEQDIFSFRQRRASKQATTTTTTTANPTRTKKTKTKKTTTTKQLTLCCRRYGTKLNDTRRYNL